MRDKFLFLLVPFILLFSFLSINYDSFCLAQPQITFDPSAYQVIQGGSESVMDFGMNPNMAFEMTHEMYTNLRYSLIDQTGFDIETIDDAYNDFVVNDLPDYMKNALVQGALNDPNAVYSDIFYQNIGLSGIKFSLGAANLIDCFALAFVTTTGQAIKLLQDDYYIKYTDLIEQTFSDSNILQHAGLVDWAQSNHMIYGKEFRFIPETGRTIFLSFPNNVILCTGNKRTNHAGYDICIIGTSSTSNFPLSGTYFRATTKIGDFVAGNFRDFTPDSTFTIDNVTLYGGVLCGLFSNSSPGSAGLILESVLKFGDYHTALQSVIDSGTTDPLVYYTRYSDGVKDALDRLKGKYVLKSQMDDLLEIIRELPIGDYPNNDGLEVPNPYPDPDILTQLNNKVDAILEQNQAVNDAINNDPDPDPDPEPDPNPLPDEAPDIPDWVLPPFLIDLIDLPIFDMFRPIFEIVGSALSVYGLWLLIPELMLIVFIIYIIVSIF